MQKKYQYIRTKLPCTRSSLPLISSIHLQQLQPTMDDSRSAVADRYHQQPHGRWMVSCLCYKYADIIGSSIDPATQCVTICCSPCHISIICQPHSPPSPRATLSTALGLKESGFTSYNKLSSSPSMDFMIPSSSIVAHLGHSSGSRPWSFLMSIPFHYHRGTKSQHSSMVLYFNLAACHRHSSPWYSE